VTLLDFARVTRAHLWMILVLTVAGAGAAYAITERLPQVYQADASGYVRVGGGDGSTGEGIAATSLGGSKADSYLPLVTSRAVAQRVIEDTGIDATPAELAGRVAANVAPNSVILEVTATGPTPEEARIVADAVIRATAEEANRIETDGNGGQGSKDSSADALVRVVPIESALDGTKIAPNLRKNVLVGALLGLVVAYLLVFLRKQLDTRIRSVADVESATSASVLGVVPAVRELKSDAGRGRLEHLGLAAESFRQVRTNLRFVGVDDPPRSIVVTSANANEGKSTVSAILARVLGETGQSVVVIDADLRRPTLARVFQTDGKVGLSQLLTGQVGLRDVLQPTDQENVRFIPAGRTPPNPSELLGSVRMRQLVEHLARENVVILDAPPLLPVTDASVLAPTCDGALLVLALGRTHKDQAALAAKMLSQVGARVVGVVLNMAPKRGLGGVHYGYGGYASDYSSRRRYAMPAAAPDDPGGALEADVDEVPVPSSAEASRPT
jgi:succinoglycan biosynthesis transport protein ExoP